MPHITTAKDWVRFSILALSHSWLGAGARITERKSIGMLLPRTKLGSRNWQKHSETGMIYVFVWLSTTTIDNFSNKTKTQILNHFTNYKTYPKRCMFWALRRFRSHQMHVSLIFDFMFLIEFSFLFIYIYYCYIWVYLVWPKIRGAFF